MHHGSHGGSSRRFRLGVREKRPERFAEAACYLQIMRANFTEMFWKKAFENSSKTKPFSGREGTKRRHTTGRTAPGALGGPVRRGVGGSRVWVRGVGVGVVVGRGLPGVRRGGTLPVVVVRGEAVGPGALRPDRHHPTPGPDPGSSNLPAGASSEPVRGLVYPFPAIISMC